MLGNKTDVFLANGDPTVCNHLGTLEDTFAVLLSGVVTLNPDLAAASGFRSFLWRGYFVVVRRTIFSNTHAGVKKIICLVSAELVKPLNVRLIYIWLVADPVALGINAEESWHRT